MGGVGDVEVVDDRRHRRRQARRVAASTDRAAGFAERIGSTAVAAAGDVGTILLHVCRRKGSGRSRGGGHGCRTTAGRQRLEIALGDHALAQQPAQGHTDAHPAGLAGGPEHLHLLALVEHTDPRAIGDHWRAAQRELGGADAMRGLQHRGLRGGVHRAGRRQLAQGALCRAQELETVLVSDQPAVDPARDRAEVVDIGERIQPVAIPVIHRGLDRVALRHPVRVSHHVGTAPLREAAVVVLAGELDEAAAAIAVAVAAGLRAVAHAAGVDAVGDVLGLACVGRRLGVAAVILAEDPAQTLGGIVEVLLRQAQAARFVHHLREKVGDAQLGVDAMHRHRRIERIEVAIGMRWRGPHPGEQFARDQHGILPGRRSCLHLSPWNRGWQDGWGRRG